MEHLRHLNKKCTVICLVITYQNFTTIWRYGMSDLLTLNIPFDPFIDFINLNRFSLSRLTLLPQWSIPPMLKIAEIDAMFWYHVVEK